MRKRRLCWTAAVGIGVIAAACLGPPAAAAPAPVSIAQVPGMVGPAQSTHPDASRYARTHPGAVPPGVNDFTCVPSAAHPRPVVLLHGTDSSAYSDYAAIGPYLADAGFCVYALNYGAAPGASTFGTEDIPTSAGQLSAFVDEVRRSSGADEVDLVGYSQGATVSRYYTNRLGGADAVRRWVGLASPTYGSTLYGLVTLAEQIPGSMDLAKTVLPAEVVSTALWQQSQGSPLLEGLNNPTDTVAGVEYTTISSRVDEVIQPLSNAGLRGAGATNLVISDVCPTNQSGHFRMPYDAFTIALVHAALDPTAGVTAPCTEVPLGDGILDMIIAENS